MLGDIGGLLDGLKGICSVLISFYFYLFGDPIHSYLLKALFLKNPQSNEELNKKSLSTYSENQYLKMRTPFSLPKVYCVCMRNRRNKKAKEKGLSTINEELEIDKFLKQ